MTAFGARRLATGWQHLGTWLLLLWLALAAACGGPPTPGATARTPAAAPAAADPLPSWNEGATRTALLDFVRAVSTEGSPDFVPAPQRIATFDNDGTLWSEQPIYFQMQFAIDRVRAMAADHPEWKTTQPFKAAVDGDMKALAASGEKGIVAAAGGDAQRG